MEVRLPRWTAVLAVLTLSSVLLFGNEAGAQSPPGPPGGVVVQGPFSGKPSSVPARNLPVTPPGLAGTPEGALERTTGQPSNITPDVDPVVQSSFRESDSHGELSAPIENFAGIAGGNPADPTGDVGPDHYVQMINSSFQIWDKQGNSLAGPSVISSIWTAAGDTTECSTTNSGDPIVLYDHLADRWLLTQFDAAGPNFAMCVAVSQTPDPTGTYFVYRFPVPADQATFPDYPKFGVWPDGYYMSTFEGDLGAYVFERSMMLTGSPARVVEYTPVSALNAPAGFRSTRLLPADLDGPLPPAGSPNFFIRSVEDQQDGADRVDIFEASVNWGDPLTSSFSLVQSVNTAPYNFYACANDGNGTPRLCIDQPTGTTQIDALMGRPMFRLQYRNFGSHETLVFNNTVDADNTAGNNTGIRWYELRRTPPGSGNWGINQQGTFAPQAPGVTDTTWVQRWMGSVAMDRAGNMALGYNVVNEDGTNSIFPGIRYTGRLASDPLGIMPQGEETLVNGTTSSNQTRWGDYTHLAVDPVDDCTFWYTAEFIGAGNARRTQIGSFQFPSCSATDLDVTKMVTPAHPNAGDEVVYRVVVRNDGDNTAADVVVTDTLPAQVAYLANTDTCTGVPVGSTGTLTCGLGDIPRGEAVSFEIKVRINPDLGGATSITNIASVSSSAADTDPSDNTFALTHLVNESADVRVTKLCKPDSQPAPAGSSGECTILVTNDGPSSARNVSVRDIHLSEGTFSLGPVTQSQGSCLVSGEDVNCTLGKIQPTETATIVVKVTSNDGVDVNDVARAASSTPDPNTGNNEGRAGLTFTASADLSIVKSDSPDPVTAGENLTYTLAVDNGGPSTASNVVVTDELPDGVSFVSATPSSGSFTASGGTVTWNLGNVGPADPSATLTITVFVHPGVTSQLVNSASVTSTTSDPNGANNIASSTTSVMAEAGLSLSKTDSPDPVSAGNNLTYTVTVSNAGPSTAQDVTVTDTLPVGTTMVSAVGGTGSTACAEVQQGIVSCEVGDLDPGASETIFITVKVAASVPNGTVLTNTATATSPTDPDGASASATTTVQTRAEVWLEKTGAAPAGNPAGALIYRITVHNHAGSAPDDTPTSGLGGPSDAQNVVVTDPLPLDNKKMTVQFLTPGCTYNQPTHTITCTAATVPAGTSATFEIQVQIKGSVGTLTNRASVTSSTVDPNLSNNSDTVNNVVKGSTGKPPRP